MSIDSPTGDIPKYLTAENATLLRLLRSAPERWTRLVRDDLTAEESAALNLLTQGGLVEVESRLRRSMAGHPVGFEMTLQYSGEAITEEERQVLANVSYPTWAEAFERWTASQAGASPPMRAELFGEERWRLSEQGAIAKRGAAGNDPNELNYLFNFLNRRGRQTNRPFVTGHLKVISATRTGEAESATAVHVGNWEEGAMAFTAAFADTVGLAQRPPANSTTDERSGGVEKTGRRRRKNSASPVSSTAVVAAELRRLEGLGIIKPNALIEYMATPEGKTLREAVDAAKKKKSGKPSTDRSILAAAKQLNRP